MWVLTDAGKLINSDYIRYFEIGMCDHSHTYYISAVDSDMTIHIIFQELSETEAQNILDEFQRDLNE